MREIGHDRRDVAEAGAEDAEREGSGEAGQGAQRQPRQGGRRLRPRPGAEDGEHQRDQRQGMRGQQQVAQQAAQHMQADGGGDLADHRPCRRQGQAGILQEAGDRLPEDEADGEMRQILAGRQAEQGGVEHPEPDQHGGGGERVPHGPEDRSPIAVLHIQHRQGKGQPPQGDAAPQIRTARGPNVRAGQHRNAPRVGQGRLGILMPGVIERKRAGGNRRANGSADAFRRVGAGVGGQATRGATFAHAPAGRAAGERGWRRPRRIGADHLSAPGAGLRAGGKAGDAGAIRLYHPHAVAHHQTVLIGSHHGESPPRSSRMMNSTAVPWVMPCSTAAPAKPPTTAPPKAPSALVRHPPPMELPMMPPPRHSTGCAHPRCALHLHRPHGDDGAGGDRSGPPQTRRR